VFGRLFGKWSGKRGGGRAGDTYVESRMPWEPDGSVVAGFAVSNLTGYLMADLKGPRGVHVETLMTVVGALAGYSAQYAIRETLVNPGKMPEYGPGGAFVMVDTKTAEKYYFGDLLNSYLIPENNEATAVGPGPYTLWGFLASAVTQCGRRPIGPDEIREIFKHTAATVGTAQFGESRLPKEHSSAMPPRSALNRAWPKVRAILARTDGPADGKALWPGYWPTVIALVAQKLVLQSKDVIDPALSMRIVFEAAVPMSKVDPATVP